MYHPPIGLGPRNEGEGDWNSCGGGGHIDRLTFIAARISYGPCSDNGYSVKSAFLLSSLRTTMMVKLVQYTVI